MSRYNADFHFLIHCEKSQQLASRMFVEWDTSPTFANPRRVAGQAALPELGLTARLELADLPRGQRIHYRVTFQDLEDLRRWSNPLVGSFVSPPADNRTVTVAWSADCVGQGWGINEAWGGLRLFETMRRPRPDVFLHLGDTIYADQPLEPEVKLDDGTTWRNLVTPAKSEGGRDARRVPREPPLQPARRERAPVQRVGVADRHLGRPRGAEQLVSDAAAGGRLPLPEKSVALLAARAKRAFLEYSPIRPDGVEPERIYRVASGARSSTSSCSTCAAIAGPTRPTSSRQRTRTARARRAAGRVAEGRTASIDRDVEDDHVQPAARPRRSDFPDTKAFEGWPTRIRGRRSDASSRSRSSSRSCATRASATSSS